ncbi:ABC transporter substrate-binding protein [Dickeya dianthicola]|uniref:ABC transporter substrate-binding protein n=1 Tax=Dickeya dianthicola TaxID=204039 RepID=A0ABX9NR90_9GAMM|nr:ABC transporter substrate-binding protein [Dickeya dianthicola]MBT1426492.1 ABC transporter substrate-binding protein [Dickeya dianthicola]MBT1458016.1 ABC transporter substrate-binding protein [Dickeya dianthicola]MBT1487153.1 ABC transporter substrate-binding protein [Dickeya dianthicola]MCI4113304.1 ABC transporter substrate-binding protein [Dickeya dianthicola]MCI4120012.1 ABC transporter substrate-binding protein [Dickeya dianthicola]
MNRRHFIKSACALSVAAAATGWPLSAAWGADTAEKPKKGGHLIVGVDNASSTDRLDPAFWFETYMYFVGSQLFNNLLELDEKGELTPSLAESWDSKDGGRTWVLHIRKGVQFHDGRALGAKDVIYSLNHHRGEKSSSSVKGYLDPVMAMDATGSHEVTIRLSEPNVEFVALLSDVHFAITPENESFDKGIGTGAFILESFQPGVRTLVKRNPNHWNSERGHVDSVETLAMNDSTARVAALVSGSAHIINRVNPRIVGRIQNMPTLQLLRSRDSQIFTFPGLGNVAPFNNEDGRLALKYAIDRQQIIDTVLGGYASVANDNPIFPSNRYFAKDIPQRPFDPEKAKWHWQKAGFSGPLTLSVADAGFPGAVDAGQLYQASAQKAGIALNVERVPDDAFWDNVWMKKPFVSSNWSVRPTADALLSLVFTSQAPWNESAWKDAGFDQLVQAARGEVNEDKRRQIYHDIQVMLVDKGSEIIPLYADALDACSNKVKGLNAIPGFPLSGNRAAEKVWLA